MSDVVYLDEPFGHLGYFSKLERAWARMPRGTALLRHRATRYDVVSSLLYEPTVFEHPSVVDQLEDGRVIRPDDIEKAFAAFVRGEFGEASMGRATPERFSPNIVGERSADLKDIETLLDRAEASLVYGREMQDLIDGRGDDVAGAIFDILSHDSLGHRRNKANVDLDKFRAAIEGQLERRERLLFLLPSFPFKDQNRFRTYSSASTVDIGEISFLARLHILALALYQVHPFGADVVVLSDGLLYAEIFGVEESLARKYREQLRGFRNLLNIQGTVSILDLSEVIEHLRMPGQVRSVFDDVRGEIANIIGVIATSDGPLRASFEVLKRGMKWNLNTRDTLAHLDDEAAWMILNESEEMSVPEALRAEWQRVDVLAAEAAITYSSINLSLRQLNVLDTLFPGALRATVHPKRGQFALPLAGNVYPWNGVGFVSSEPAVLSTTSTRPLHELSDLDVELVRLDMTGEPLYLTEAREGADLRAAVVALPAVSQKFGDLDLRPLTIEDVSELHAILSEREDMTWEGERASEEYTKSLVEFRIAHYERYGFGVLAVADPQGRIIGQAGLQVLDETGERIEIVIFLASARVGSGLGTTLLEDLLRLLAAQGFGTVWATVRHGNERARRLLLRFGFVKDAETVHFNMPCTMWRLDMRHWRPDPPGA